MIYSSCLWLMSHLLFITSLHVVTVLTLEAVSLWDEQSLKLNVTIVVVELYCMSYFYCTCFKLNYSKVMCCTIHMSYMGNEKAAVVSSYWCWKQPLWNEMMYNYLWMGGLLPSDCLRGQWVHLTSQWKRKCCSECFHSVLIEKHTRWCLWTNQKNEKSRRSAIL